MNIKTKNKGFTIIEVVLVLAIAGLIFMMVFIALPALQRNQRDTQRKNDLSRLQSALTSYSSANRGSLPTNWNDFVEQYLLTAGDTFIDPSGAQSGQTNQDSYQLSSSTLENLTGDFEDRQNIIYYSVGYTCSEGGAVESGAGSRKVAFRMFLEGGGIHCLNN